MFPCKRVSMTLYGIEKEMLSFKELHCWHHKKKKTGLCGWAGISAIGDIWFTRDAHAKCKLEVKKETKGQRKSFTFKFFLSYLIHEFLFHQLEMSMIFYKFFL